MQRAIAWQIVLSLLAIILWIGCSAKSLVASSLWGTTWGGQLCCYRLDVHELNVTTGGIISDIQIPGSGSRAGVLDFASDPIGRPSVVWSINYTTESGYRLLSFNPHQKLLLSNVQLDNTLALNGLAIDPTSGVLYGTSMTALYRLDPTTGQASLIGSTSLRVDGALGFDLDGNLFGVRGVGGLAPPPALVSVNKLTGETTKVADIDAWPADIAVRPEDGEMYGLGFSDNTRYTYSLHRIDATTGGVSDVGQSIDRPSGLAFTSVPEPTTLTLALLASAVVAVRRIRRVGECARSL